MSLLDEKDVENTLTSKVYEQELFGIASILDMLSCRIIVNNKQWNNGTYYTDMYRTDYLIGVKTDSVPWNCEQKIIPTVEHVEQVDGNIIAHHSQIHIYLEPKSYAGAFSYLSLFVENDEIILEPLDRIMPILVKNANGWVEVYKKYKFRLPKNYCGYVKCVDSDPITVSKMFPGCMIIPEYSINQSL